MKGFSLIEGMILSFFISLLFLATYYQVNTEYSCINGIVMKRSSDGDMWKQSGEYPKYCINNDGAKQ